LNPCYAIIPAAGISQRMGQPKLLLPWPARQSEPATMGTVIDRVLEAWTTSRVAETIVVIRSIDEALCEACRRWPVTIVHPPETTVDMKGSVCVGLQALISRGGLAPDARCFIAPADLPGLTSHVIDRLIDATSSTQKILVPRFGHTLETSLAGHPALLPWELSRAIFSLGPQEGVDALMKRHPQEFVLFPPEFAASDFDTPDEYQAAFLNANS
jgi:molybdenum cofactor cytidylyltransferase